MTSLHEETLALTKSKLRPIHPDTLSVTNNLAVSYQAAGRLDRALPLLEETLVLTKSKLGPLHPDTLLSMNNLAVGYQATGQLDRAQPLLEETLDSMNKLGTAPWSAKRLDRSIPLLEECLKLRRLKSGEENPETMLVKANPGVNYKDAGRLAEALPLLNEANRAVRKYPQLRGFRGQILDAYIKNGQHAEAAAGAREALAEDRATFRGSSPQLAGSLAQAGSSLLKTKNWTEAEVVLREALTIREAKEPSTVNSMEEIASDCGLLSRYGRDVCLGRTPPTKPLSFHTRSPRR